MLKIAAAGATALCAGILLTTPYSLSVTPQGSVSLSMDRAAARIGHPLTPMSIAGVHRRAMRRHVAFHRPLVRRPVLAAAAVGATATGAGWGWGGWGWNRPLFAYGGTGAGWGWGGWGWNRPLFAYAGNGMRPTHEPPYTEAEMAAARYGCYPTSFDYSTHVCLPR
jgi:hypothetical protein